MMVDVLSLEGERIKKMDLPGQFAELYHPNLIRRAVSAVLSKLRQAYGHKPGAGMVHSGKISRRRRNYKGAYGHAYSRVPRKTMLRRGRQFYWVGAVAPGTVGGRRAHGPKSEKSYEKKINKKERKKAIRSALSMSVDEKKMFVFEDKIEGLKKTKDVSNIISKTVLKEINVSRKIRSGKGKMRGRKYKTGKGVLFVVSKTCDLNKSAQSLAGADVVNVNSLNAADLVKGHKDIRNSVWSESAVKKIKEDNLFK